MTNPCNKTMKSPCEECIVFPICNDLCDKAINYKGSADTHIMAVLKRKLDKYIENQQGLSNQWAYRASLVKRLYKGVKK